MLDITIDVNDNDLRRLNKMPSDFRKGLLEGVRKGMMIAEATSKKRMGKHGEIGVKSGHLRRSVHSKVQDEGDKIIGMLYSNVVYARIHELGGTIRPRTKKYLRFKVNGKWVSKKEVTIPARPYLRPSIEENVERIKDVIVNSIIRKVED